MTADDDRAARGLAGAGPAQSVLLIVRFLTEIALIAVLVWGGVGASLPLAGRIVIAVAAPVLAMVIWGRWLAPRASRRSGGYRTVMAWARDKRAESPHGCSNR